MPEACKAILHVLTVAMLQNARNLLMVVVVSEQDAVAAQQEEYILAKIRVDQQATAVVKRCIALPERSSQDTGGSSWQAKPLTGDVRSHNSDRTYRNCQLKSLIFVLGSSMHARSAALYC